VALSLKYDRQAVIDLAHRIGVDSPIRKSCSMALGDGGLTVLEHTGAYATFANSGKLAKPYAVLELMNSRGEVIYSRDKDEPPAPQVVAPKHVAYMNQMMQMVVEEGTGKRAHLDFTTAVGKTGTSSSYRDAWFMGFTGDYVTGVWIGNDDNRPMDQVTGGAVPAGAWHDYMVVAHTNMNIGPILGISIHPNQVELANEIFTPPAKEVERAEAILASMKTAHSTGSGAASLNGVLIDAASIRQAEVIVKQMAMIRQKTGG